MLQSLNHLCCPPPGTVQQLCAPLVLWSPELTQHCRCGLTRAEQRGRITSLDLLAAGCAGCGHGHGHKHDHTQTHRHTDTQTRHGSAAGPAPGRCGPAGPAQLARPRAPDAVVAAEGKGRGGPGRWRRARRDVPDGGGPYILVRMKSAAETGYCFNIRRLRLQEKLVLLRYDPIAKQRVLFTEKRKIRSV
ncbi:large ribosomal subunit protein bL33m isoform 1-T1 [Geothlypis trichas]